jgi:Mg2+ and Co2+ transporter CorA
MSNLHSTAVIIERKFELARNTFQTAIDANLSEYSKKLDQIMRKFAIIATMFIPLQLISGMWGMN